MKITVLVDNNTFIDQYYYGEPAVSYYLEIDDKKICLMLAILTFFLKMLKNSIRDVLPV